MRDIGTWQQLGNKHKDGSWFVGIDLGRVDPYADAGTPVLNKLVQATVTADVASVRIGDRVRIRFDGDRHWWALLGDVRLGRLPWAPSDFNLRPWQERPYPRIDDGELEVTRLLVSSADVVTNIGGIVRPV